jgi:hypothetical protein
MLSPRPTQSPSPVSQSSEEGRAFLQTRVALFWKVMFGVTLISSAMGAVGAIIYSLGAVAYCLLAGTDAFDGKSIGAVVDAAGGVTRLRRARDSRGDGPT